MLKDNSSSVGPIFQFPFQIDYLLIQLYAAIHFHTHSHHAFFRASSRTNSNRKNSNRGSNRIELNFESIDSWWIITNKRIESRWRRSASLITVSQPLAADRKAGYHGVRNTVWKTSVKKAGGSWRDRGKFIGESRASAIGKCASVYLGTTRKLPEGGAILHTCTQEGGGGASFYSNMQTFEEIALSSLVLQKRAFPSPTTSNLVYILEMIRYLKLYPLRG